MKRERRSKVRRLKRLTMVLTLLVVVAFTLAALLPAAAPGGGGQNITTNASVNPSEIRIGDTTNVTLWVNNTPMIRNVHAYHVLPVGVKYVGNATIEPTRIGDTLRWVIGNLTRNSTWNVSFDVRLLRWGENIPVNVLPGSKVTYSRARTTIDNLTITGGEINIGPTNNPDARFQLTLPNGTMITRDHLMQKDFEGYRGNATHIRVKPKGNPMDRYLIINGTKYTLHPAVTYEIRAESMWVDLIRQGPGMGRWEIRNITATNASITNIEGEVQFPPLTVDVGAFTFCRIGSSINITPARAVVIGEPVKVTGHARVSNTVKAANLTLELSAGTMVIHRVNRTRVPVGETEIQFSAIWIPMSSGEHTITLSVYELKKDGTRFWVDAQGPNSKNRTVAVRIQRVR